MHAISCYLIPLCYILREPRHNKDLEINLYFQQKYKNAFKQCQTELCMSQGSGHMLARACSLAKNILYGPCYCRMPGGKSCHTLGLVRVMSHDKNTQNTLNPSSLFLFFHTIGWAFLWRTQTHHLWSIIPNSTITSMFLLYKKTCQP